MQIYKKKSAEREIVERRKIVERKENGAENTDIVETHIEKK